MLETLASYRRCCERIQSNWPWFAARQKERLQQQERYGIAAEKVWSYCLTRRQQPPRYTSSLPGL